MPQFSESSVCHEHDECAGPCGCPGHTSNGDSGHNDKRPRDHQHPPGCPADNNADHSWLVDRYQPLTATALAATPLPLLLSFSSTEGFLGVSVLSQEPERPIYLTLCTLLI